MLIRLSPRRDEQAALTLDDVASQLDAGLAPDQIGGNPADGDRMLAELMVRRHVVLDAVDDAVLVAAWQAGRGPDAVRRLADQRRRRAEFARSILRSLRYPAALVVVASTVAFVTGRAVGATWLPIAVGILLVVGTALGVMTLQGLRHGGERWLRLPLLGAWAQDVAELPYLEILHGLYASGVSLQKAHPQAVAACPVAAVRERLRRADATLQQGRPLAEALGAADPVDRETLQLLGNGERTGNLEEALLRALGRRRDVAQRRTTTLARLVGNLAYAFGVTVAVVTIWSFYSSYFAMLRSIR